MRSNDREQSLQLFLIIETTSCDFKDDFVKQQWLLV